MRTYSSAVSCFIIASKNCQCRASANCHLLNKGHEIVWNSTRIFTNITTGMCTNWVEVSQQYNFPIRICTVDITTNFFDDKLKREKLSLDIIVSIQQIIIMKLKCKTLVRPYGFVADKGNSSVHGTSFGQPYTVAEDENTSWNHSKKYKIS